MPLVISWPGHVREGERSRGIVNLVDIGATMLAAAGAAPLPRSRGRSLLPLGADGDAPWVDQTFSEYVTDLSSPWTGPQATQQRMVRHGRWKYVHISGHPPQLFDLAADPAETRDLGTDPAYADVRSRLLGIGARGLGHRCDRAGSGGTLRRKGGAEGMGRRTHPVSQFHYPIRAEDSWLEATADPVE